jgi:2'-5' RNA ligase
LKALEKSVAGIGRLRIAVKGTGAFPNLRKPRVFWVGANEQSGKLCQLASILDKELRNLGFKEEDRPFKPHLTLGRVQGKVAKVCDIIREMEDKIFGEFEAGEIILFRSELKPTGAEYTRLGVVPLK